MSEKKEVVVKTIAAAPAIDPDILAAVVDETARRVEAGAARPSPIHLRTWEEIERFADKAARSGMAPKDYVGKPDAICIAVQLGSELGLAPMQALTNIAVINGRPTLWGDAIPALCRASGMVSYIREWHEGEGDNLTYYCEAKRKDDPNKIVGKFSVSDAKRAKLWQEEPTVRRKSRDGGTYEADSGPWYSYRERMLQMRARGFGLRDAFPDVLKGLITAEEAMDIPHDDAPAYVPAPPPVTAKSADTPPRRTWATLLDEIEADFTAVLTREEVDGVLASDKVQKALDGARNGARERLDSIIQAATGRTGDAALAAKAETGAASDGDLTPDPEVETFIARAPRLTDAELHRLDSNAAHKTWLRSLAPDDYARVDAAIQARVAGGRAASWRF